MKNFLPFLILISLITLTGISIFNLNQKQSTSQKQSSSEELSDESPEDSLNIHFVKENIVLPEFSLPDLYDPNKTFSKKDLLGKYSLINLFASWCTTCRAEHITLLRLKGEKIIKMYGVAWRDIDENTKHYLEKSGNPFHRVVKDSRGIFTKFINLKAVPETLIVNPEGIIVMRFRGNLQEFSIDEIRRFLESRHDN